ncbi:MAG: TIGR03915 family putative DNA repair protein [Pseudomonadota bacterium]|nr:TIGR03915 family putative DNA repair protein [Pseudomonadota bacterium]MEE3071176.1 TIGR03915 family putative DNA repair protein [Pseudomonadota bacterium]
MEVIWLEAPDDFDGWRMAARALAVRGVPPEDVLWQVGDEVTDLFAGADLTLPKGAKTLNVPKDFIELARMAVLHRDPQRFALLYGLLLRVGRDPRVMQDRADPLVRRLSVLVKAIRRDIHKMRAFVRFREMPVGNRVRYISWFEPDHHILRANAGFFVGRFANMEWSILTPDGSVHWDGDVLTEGAGASRSDIPDEDPTEKIWEAYYASIFNPSRLMTGAMLREMPKKYWKNMPETRLITGMIAGARSRELEMIERSKPKA